MNDRIKELSLQASKDNSDGYPVTLEYTNRFAEKFAQLIVAECAEIALTDGQATGNFEVFNKITKHFGVKE
jgi:hypothetical protein